MLLEVVEVEEMGFFRRRVIATLCSGSVCGDFVSVSFDALIVMTYKLIKFCDISTLSTFL